MIPNEIRIGQNSDHRGIARFLFIARSQLPATAAETLDFQKWYFHSIKVTGLTIIITWRNDLRWVFLGPSWYCFRSLKTYACSLPINFRNPITSMWYISGQKAWTEADGILLYMHLHANYWSASLCFVWTWCVALRILNAPFHLSLQSSAHLGGIGKTQLALKYADTHRQRYPCKMFFLSARSEATFNADSSRICEVLQLSDGSDPLRQFKKWLSRRENAEWLLILNNADDLGSIRPTKFFPKNRVGTHYHH